MAFELKDGQGTLHKNAKKEAGSQQPDYRGDLMVGGVLHEIAGWIKQGQRGPWMSLQFKPKEAREAPPAKPQPKSAPVDDGDDIPF